MGNSTRVKPPIKLKDQGVIQALIKLASLQITAKECCSSILRGALIAQEMLNKDHPSIQRNISALVTGCRYSMVQFQIMHCKFTVHFLILTKTWLHQPFHDFSHPRLSY